MELHPSGRAALHLRFSKTDQMGDGKLIPIGPELGGNLTAHSFRVGAALDMLERGVSMEKIMLRGGWEASSTVIKYLRAWQAV